MVQSPTATVIEKQIRIAAGPEVVYEFLTDAGKLARWMAPDVVADARPGGSLRMNFNGFDIGRGEYVELVPAKRVVYTWAGKHSGISLLPDRRRSRSRSSPTAQARGSR